MNEHLAAHRRLILARSLAAGAVALVPVPFADDLLAGAVRTGLIRRIAELRRVDLDAGAVAELATPRGSRALQAAGWTALPLVRRGWRRMAGGLVLVRRVDEAVETFQVATLFDHYCALHHVGLGLDGARAAALRATMDRAVGQARSDTLARAFRAVFRAPLAWAVALPRALRRRRADPSAAEVAAAEVAAAEVVAAEVVDPPPRVLAAAANAGYLGALLAAFDAAWEPYKTRLLR